MKKYTITSSSNKIYKLFQSLLTSKGVNEFDQALTYGAKHIQDTIKNHRESCIGVILTANMTPPPLGIADAALYELSQDLFDSLDVFRTKHPILLIKAPDIFEWQEPAPELGMSLLLPLQDPTNMGACLRVAAAFGVSDIILTPTSCHPFLPRSMRSAAAHIFGMKYHYVKDLSQMKNSELKIYALAMDGTDIEKVKFPKKFILALGTEGPGISELLEPDHKILIPMESTVESLNVNSALSICLYKWKVSISS